VYDKTMKQAAEEKPKRLYFKSYLQVIKNSVGSNMFRNFYVETPGKGEFDALDDGSDACAFFVSSILTLFKKLSGIHGTVVFTVKDLENSGWQKIEDQPKPGDVLLWEAQSFGDKMQEHLGFYIGNNEAVSTSYAKKTPVIHSYNFDGKRKINGVYRMEHWDD
jgi:hypothetical protein